MKVILGVLMFVLGLYLYNKEIRNAKEGVRKFNAIWKYRANGFVYALLVGGALLLLSELIMWVVYIIEK
jgi:hypothetical protein